MICLIFRLFWAGLYDQVLRAVILVFMILFESVAGAVFASNPSASGGRLQHRLPLPYRGKNAERSQKNL